jgi:AcrR family transcriptional regulator
MSPSDGTVVRDGGCEAREVEMVTPECGLRERKKARTREAIINAAIDLFEQQGYDATTVEEIAAGADVSERTFFRYFESKLDVVMAQKTGATPDLEAHLANRPPEERPLEAFRQVLLEELREVLAGDELRVRQFQVVMRTPALRSFAHEHFNEHRDELARAFAKRMELPDDALAPQVMATAAAGVVWTVIDRWVADGAAPARLAPLLEEGFRLLATGLG